MPAAIAHEVAATPPVASLFATFLGYNPIKELLAPTGILSHLPPHNVAVLTGKEFFPQLISGPFHHGLVIVFSMAMTVLVIAAGASLLRGKPLRARRARRGRPAVQRGGRGDRGDGHRRLARAGRGSRRRGGRGHCRPGGPQTRALTSPRSPIGSRGNGSSSTFH